MNRDRRRDGGGYGRRPGSPSRSRSRSRSPPTFRPPQVPPSASASVSASASGSGARVLSPMKAGIVLSKKSATPEEGQITSPICRDRRSPVPVPFYRNRVREAPRNMGTDDYDRSGYREPRYPPSGPSSYSRRSPSPPPPPITRRRSRSRTRTPRSRSPTPSSCSYSSRSRSSPDKARSPKLPPASYSNSARPYFDQDRERNTERSVGFPATRLPPSGPRSDRIPPTGPRVISGERASAPPYGPSADRAPPPPPPPTSTIVNPYATPIERDPRMSHSKPGVISNAPARGSPLRPQSPLNSIAPPPRVIAPNQEIENPYGRPIAPGHAAGNNAARLSWSDRKSGQAATPATPVQPVSRSDLPDQHGQGQSPLQADPSQPEQRDLAVSIASGNQPPVNGQPQASTEDLQVIAKRMVEARIQAELPAVKLWSTKAKWEEEVSVKPRLCDFLQVYPACNDAHWSYSSMPIVDTYSHYNKSAFALSPQRGWLEWVWLMRRARGMRRGRGEESWKPSWSRAPWALARDFCERYELRWTHPRHL